MSEVLQETKPNVFRRCADKLFGGINMSWVKVIIFAVAAAVVTDVFLIVPIFDGTSFYEMGVSFEAWVLFAVIIMVNCKKPLESALKVFVFFLISQPLIYLIEVPFTYMGWAIFGYYRTWFILTLCTFPAAFVGWYLKKGNWLSLLILTPVNVFLALIGYGYFKNNLVPGFPDHMLSVLFCFGQIVLYLLVFFRGWKQRLAGFGAVVIAVVAMLLIYPAVDTGVSMPLPGDPVLSDSATVRMEDDSYGEVNLSVTDGEGYISVRMKKRGEVKLIVTDGDKVYEYKAFTLYENGHERAEITQVDQRNE